jgi:hypothetical protein
MMSAFIACMSNLITSIFASRRNSALRISAFSSLRTSSRSLLAANSALSAPFLHGRDHGLGLRIGEASLAQPFLRLSAYRLPLQVTIAGAARPRNHGT